MEAAALEVPEVRSPGRAVQLVLVRANAPLFYSVASASLLESATPSAADRLLHFYGSDPNLDRWLRGEWLPRKLEHAQWLRDYVCSTWPEYDWYGGYEGFRALAAERRSEPSRPTGAHEALARCVAAAQGGIFYRSLARWAEDRPLRERARVMALDEARSFAHFRALYDRRLRGAGLACPAAWSTALGCVRTARDAQVPRAFSAIRMYCAPHVPFPTLDYPEFVGRMGAVIERHAQLGLPERILFRTWKRVPRTACAGITSGTGSSWSVAAAPSATAA